MLELVFQLIGEVLIQLAAHAAAELFGRGALEVFRRPHPASAWLAAVGYVVWGLLFGWLSLVIFPKVLITAQIGRVLNLLVTPVLVGLLVVAWGRWLRSHGRIALQLNTFFYGYLFALALALVRYAGVH